MKILITGASSYVGASIYAQLRTKYPVIGTYNSNQRLPELVPLDITKEQDVMALVSRARPDVIIHAAANASASWCDKNPELAVAINQQGTQSIVTAADKANSKVVFISSLAVANTESLYGRTKIMSEQYVRGTQAGYVILRPSLIIGLSPNTTNDRPFNRLLRNITEGVPAVYDTSWRFQPTWLRHLDEVIEAVLERGIANQTIPVCVPESKSRYDIAMDILQAFGIKVIPEDKHDATPAFSESLDKLRELGLPQHTYAEMVAGVIQEINGFLRV